MTWRCAEGHPRAEPVEGETVEPCGCPVGRPEWLRDMTVLQLEPGDIVVVRGPSGHTYTPDAMARIRETLDHVASVLGIAPDRMLFMEGSCEIGVVRQ